MLKKIDLNRKLEKSVYKEKMDELEIHLGQLQRQILEYKIPVIILFEGWEAAGKGTLINRLILRLDPRQFSVFTAREPNEEEAFRPFLWRFWKRTPADGRMSILDRSWYRRVSQDRVNGRFPKSEWEHTFREINFFERQLTSDGAIIIKFFLHISQKEQKKRFKKLQKDPAMVWRITDEDWISHRQYDEYLAAYEDMLAETDTAVAPWHIVESHDVRFATLKIFQIVCQKLENGLNIAKKAAQATEAVPVEAAGTDVELRTSILAGVDLDKSLDRKDYEKELDKYQERIRELEHTLYQKRIPVVIVYEGWDAAGKGGNIKRLTQLMDPRGYDVIPIAAPNDIERKHHYLWRFWKEFPKAGHFAIFDRSWYGRVMVERVEGFCSEAEWKRAYREINEMEAQLTNFGTVIVKFWLHIDKETQLRRFKLREATPHKRYKITDEDWRNREKWDLYEAAVDEMLFRTSSTYAPWTIIESNCKLYARVKALKTVVDAIEQRLKSEKKKS
ncbi:MAG: phosphate--AMP phosphotransferase [Calditrichaeota bacterium]|nr:phosphate--AMP phosphotransferase [Calditrichota bacterium]MCB0287109.1 phosphate--AMP phosphotransferase [Calditrichota bacterium]MCB0300266.1 phosphate--AMP phosphotransferase [Calditrichota bacterium]MCB9070095.1 phosphate--AMP phosphotransferase [Calditrichia bacterium]